VVDSRVPRLKQVILEDVAEHDADLDESIEALRWMKDNVEVVYLPREDLQFSRVFDRMLVENAAK